MRSNSYGCYVACLASFILLVSVVVSAQPTIFDGEANLPTIAVVATQSAYYNTSIAQLDLETGECTYEEPSVTNPILRGWWASYAIDLARGILFAHQNEYYTLSTWNTNDGSMLAQQPSGSTSISGLVFSPRDQMLYGMVQTTRTAPYTYYLVQIDPKYVSPTHLLNLSYRPQTKNSTGKVIVPQGGSRICSLGPTAFDDKNGIYYVYGQDCSFASGHL